MFVYNEVKSGNRGGIMKVVAKPIDIVSWTDKTGAINPVRFRITNEDEGETVIKVDRVITHGLERLNGNKMYLYRCQSRINGVEKIFELRYEVSTCKWMLWKI